MDPTQTTTTDTTETTPETAAGARRSVVDTLFDRLTVQTAKGLVVAKQALETVARWLDDRAKTVGELATKLAASPPSEAAEAPTESAPT